MSIPDLGHPVLVPLTINATVYVHESRGLTQESCDRINALPAAEREAFVATLYDDDDAWMSTYSWTWTAPGGLRDSAAGLPTAYAAFKAAKRSIAAVTEYERERRS